MLCKYKASVNMDIVSAVVELNKNNDYKGIRRLIKDSYYNGSLDDWNSYELWSRKYDDNAISDESWNIIINEVVELMDNSLAIGNDISKLRRIASELYSYYHPFPYWKAIIPHGSDNDYQKMIDTLWSIAVETDENTADSMLKIIVYTALNHWDKLDRFLHLMSLPQNNPDGILYDFISRDWDVSRDMRDKIIVKLLSIVDIDTELQSAYDDENEDAIRELSILKNVIENVENV